MEHLVKDRLLPLALRMVRLIAKDNLHVVFSIAVTPFTVRGVLLLTRNLKVLIVTLFLHALLVYTRNSSPGFICVACLLTRFFRLV